MVNKFIYPQEIEVWYILPTIRKAMASQMKERGVEQKRIASILNVTEAAISQYSNKKRASKTFFDKSLKKEISLSVDRILENKNLVFSETYRILNLPKIKEKICSIHKKCKGVKKNCRICMQK